MGTTAIIVCVTSSVAKIATMCRQMLQMPAIISNVVEAIGTRDAINVSVCDSMINHEYPNQIEYEFLMAFSISQS